MIPSITPPTDNLYKFISLFGLAIFLFAMYNLGIVYDQSATNKIQIEGFKVELQKEIYKNEPFINEHLKPHSEKRFRPAMIRRLNSDIENIEKIIVGSHLEPIKIYELEGKVSKLKISLDALWLKQWFTIIFVLAGIAIMWYGFRQWKKRDQDIRDKILEIEHIIKQNERDKKSKSKKKKVTESPAIPEILTQGLESN